MKVSALTITMIYLLASIVLSGCCTRPQMTEFTERYTTDMKDSPVIMVGVVSGDSSPAGDVHPARYSNQELVQRYRIKVKVETVLQGEVPRTQIDVYFFLANINFTGSGIPLRFTKANATYSFFNEITVN